jgi:hypothetical protein
VVIGMSPEIDSRRVQPACHTLCRAEQGAAPACLKSGRRRVILQY